MVVDAFAILVIREGVIFSAPAGCKAARGGMVLALNNIVMNGGDEQIKCVVQ